VAQVEQGTLGRSEPVWFNRCMRGRLLEREAELRGLREALDEACQGRGSVVLISGEAGIGKTSLVRAFAASAADWARIRVGVCDDLETPRTLGPFRDMARLAGGPLAGALEPVAERDAVFGAAWQELADATTVMIVEDVHWADDATLDVLRYLAWRAGELPSVLVLTYRDEELRDDHPLRRLLGTLARRGVRRLEPRRLSAGAVERLAAARGLDPGVVLHATGGNPFFVAEVLASPDVEVPATVRDAVLARVAELGEGAQRSLELLSTVPGRVERWLVDGLLGDAAGQLEEAERRGLLEADEAHVWFRHELARRAIEQGLPSTARLAHNRRVLAALAARPHVELSRLAHHARAAGEAELVVEYGLAAAREAAGAGAFHEALDHYELALRSARPLPDERRATVLEDSVWVLYNLSRFDLAVARAREVVRLREPLGDRATLGQALTTLSRMLYMVNDPAGSEAAATRAVGLLEPLGDLGRLARAATYLAAILTLTDRPEEAIAWARRALELGERTGQWDVAAHSLNYLGYAMLDLGDPAGATHLRRAVAVAREAHHYEYAQRAWTNLVEGLYRLGRFDELDEPIERGLAYSREYGFASHEYNLEAHRCMLLTLRGRWDEAEAGLRRLLAVEEDPGVLASFGLSALGRLLARRADPDAAGLLERAWGAATRTNSVQAIALAGIARVEAAWLAGDHRAARELAELPLARTAGRGAERYRGELLRYLARSGAEVAACESCPPEHELGIQGDWRGAAAAWGALGAPYEQALELLEAGRQPELLQALATLEALGAVAAADLARRELRRIGVTRLPSRPLPRTRANPAGLTDRQLEVLDLLAQGLTNAEIADRLVVSVRTVDHHVAAILSKLNVRTRREAVRAYASTR
jgi:DNA-binding CsgD family transcriptional regulator/tetratricopeptide (TPR) repeat protein